jgi:hypothetical protein
LDKDSSKSFTSDTKKEFTLKSDLSTLGLFGSETAKPSFSLGSTTTKRRSLQNDDVPKKSLLFKDNEQNKVGSSDKVPTFAFGKQDDKSKTDHPVSKPAFLFGTTSKPSESNSSIPAFLFGSESKSEGMEPAKPVRSSSFGKTSDEPTPFQFSAASSTISTSKETDDKVDNKAEKKVPTLFGKPETSGLLFGLKGASSESPKPAFQFDQTSASSKIASKTGTFSFDKDSGQNETQSQPKPFTFESKSSTEPKTETKNPKSTFSFGSSTTPKPEPAKNGAFLFGSKPDTSSTASKPFSFNADQASTGKPNFSFGKTNETTPSGKPSFTFGATTSGPSSTPTGLLNSNSNSTPGGVNPTFSSGTIPSGGSDTAKQFSFGTPGPSGASTVANAAAKPIGNPNFKFAAGVQPVKSFTDTSNAFGGFGNKAANTGGQFSFGHATNPSRQTTPTSFNFGGPTTTANPASIFGQPASNGTSTSANATFNFGGHSREATPNPSEIFGGSGMSGFNPMSMPQPQFGTPQGNVFGGINSTPTPPLQGMPSNRKIAMMRKRRGH